MLAYIASHRCPWANGIYKNSIDFLPYSDSMHILYSIFLAAQALFSALFIFQDKY